MIHLIGELWPFLLAALAVGLVTGWLTGGPPPREEAGR